VANPYLFSQPVISWQNCFGGSSGEGAKHIIKTSDGGFLIVGTTYSNDGDVTGMHFWFNAIDSTWIASGDYWVLKIDSNYNIQWQKCLGGSSSDYGMGAIETVGGYMIIGASASNDGDITFSHGDSDYWLVKLDYSGTIIGQHSYGGSNTDAGYGIESTPDAGFILTGYTQSNDGDVTGYHGSVDIWIVKIDSVGNLIWQRSLGGSYVDYNATSKLDALGNVYVAGLAISIDGDVTGSHGGGDAWLVKLDQNGNILWQKCFGGTGGDQFNNLDIKGAKLVMTGWTTSVDGDLSTNYGVHDAWVVLTDTSGNIVFSQNYGGSLIDEMFAVKFTSHNKIIACGYSYSNDVQVTMNHTPKDCWLICVDSIGNLIWQNS